MDRKENTFVVQIKDTQASTWQGSVLWVEENKKEIFRSALELIKLMDSAVEKNKQGVEVIKTRLWEK